MIKQIEDEPNTNFIFMITRIVHNWTMWRFKYNAIVFGSNFFNKETNKTNEIKK